MRFYIILLLFFASYISKGQTADFTFSTANGLFCSPVSVSFTQNSTGNPIGYIWDFGNGTRSNGANPSTTYTSPGTYQVKLTNIYDQSVLDVVKTITISAPVTVSISANRSYICKPGIVNFNASGMTGTGTFVWDFGDGTPAQTTSTNNLTHTFSSYGSFNVSVKATAASGCFASASIPITVQVPAITASVSPPFGCIPATANFNASVNLPVGGSVTSYKWDFGDGSPVANNTLANINHIYTAIGSFTPKLDVTTNEGCTNSFVFPALSFGTPPTSHTAYLRKDTICGSETFTMISKAVNANSYTWDFGDGTVVAIADTITTHKYTTLGTKQITVTPYFNGCPGNTITLHGFVHGIIASFTSVNVCTNKRLFNFTDATQGNVTSNTWNFGDGAVVNNSNNPSHSFALPGAYFITLTVNDATTGCSDIIPNTLYYASPSLVNPDTSVCKGSTTTFSIANNYSNPNALYTWHVAGVVLGPVNTPSITFNTSVLGTFNNYVIVDNGIGYCGDTIYHAKTLTVKGPNLSYISPTDICLNDSLRVTNTSAAFFATDTIRQWIWNFGERTVNDSIYQPKAYKYGGAGAYNIKLFARDKNGCVDSLIKPLTVNGLPFVITIPKLDTICLGQNSQLISFHSDSLRWTPASLVACPTCDTISVSPPTTTLFIATATNAAGCKNSDTSTVLVFTPFTAAPSFTDSSICLNDSVRLDALPKGKKAVWSPTNGLSASDIYNPYAYPTQTTQYKVALTDSVGCFSDTGLVNITVNTLPVVDAGPSMVYPYNTVYQLKPTYGSSVRSYQWTPITLLSCFSCPIPTGTSLYSETFQIKVVSDSGCIAKDTVSIFVECKEANLLMPTAFSPDNNGTNEIYFPLTRGIKTIKNFTIYNRMGQLVFQAKNFRPNDKAFGWNGKYNNQEQPVGAYVFVLEAICEAAQSTIVRKGTFILIR